MIMLAWGVRRNRTECQVVDEITYGKSACGRRNIAKVIPVINTALFEYRPLFSQKIASTRDL
jgi:hypothetical protein